MLRVDFVAEDTRLVAVRDISSLGKWDVVLKDDFEQIREEYSLTDMELGYTLLLLSAGDEQTVVDSVPVEIKAHLDAIYRTIRPYP